MVQVCVRVYKRSILRVYTVNWYLRKSKFGVARVLMDNRVVYLMAVNWALLVFVFVCEHFILTRIYSKRSSLQRLFIDRSDSAKGDLVFWFVVYCLLPFFEMSLMYLTLPGLAWTGIIWVLQRFGIYPITHHFLVKNPILWIGLFYVLYDFATYISHVLMHKIPFLWNVHKLHHSATEMNIVTGSRESLAERAFKYIPVIFLVSLALGFRSPEAALAVIVIRTVIDLLQHSDLPWDYGVFGHIIASPRFHRFHHTNNAEDVDSNYGDIFSVWDYLFRTVKPKYIESTAVSDNCPLGLNSEVETRRINSQWFVAPLNHTFAHYLFLLLKRFRTGIGTTVHEERA